ncbi:hypothetical protein AVEN_247666-1, partial [Araneus ventricosus]
LIFMNELLTYVLYSDQHALTSGLDVESVTSVACVYGVERGRLAAADCLYVPCGFGQGGYYP